MSNFDLPLTSHMVAPVHAISPDGRLASAAQMLAELGVSALPVVDSRRRLIGVLERADLLRVGRLRLRPEPGEPRFWWPDVSVAECMQTTVPVAPPERTLRQCAQRMLERGLHRVYVLDDNVLTGVLSTRELLRAVEYAQLATPIGVLGQLADTLDGQQPLAAACGRLAASPGQALLLLAGDAPVAIFARSELRACLEVEPAQPSAPYGDESLIVLDAAEAAWRAAQRALAAKARYIVARDSAQRYRVLSGLSFARCICGDARGPQLTPELLPKVSIPAAPPVSAPPEAASAHRAASAARPPARHPTAAADTPRTSERRSEPSLVGEPGSDVAEPASRGGRPAVGRR